MQRFMSVHAADANGAMLLQQCLGQLGEPPPEASLGFIYATAATAAWLPHIVAGLQQWLPGVYWLGCVGEGVCAAGREYYDEPAVSLLLTDIPPENFCLLAGTDDLSAQLPGDVVAWCERHPDSFGLLHAVPSYIATSAYVSEIRRHSPAAHLNGGLSSSAGNYRHIENGVRSHGISGVLFSGQVPYLSDLSQGCSPIGAAHRVSEAHQNMVLQLDGRPALEVLRETVGEVLWRDPRRLGNYIFVGLPANSGRDNDYLVRNLMGLDLEGGAIAVGDLMERRTQLRFCRRDGNAARDDLLAMLQRLKGQLAGRPIRGGIYISCVGRGRRQFGHDSEELGMIAAELGDFPLSGFFANGEFYHGRLYSYTGVLTLFL